MSYIILNFFPAIIDLHVAEKTAACMTLWNDQLVTRVIDHIDLFIVRIMLQMTKDSGFKVDYWFTVLSCILQNVSNI